jgi:hypothetical protein
VDYERKMVVIKHMSYFLGDEAEIYHESDPENIVLINNLQRGQRVEYYFMNQPMGMPIIGTLIILE